jgi:hypothetical protein
MHCRARALGPWAVIVTSSTTGLTTELPGLSRDGPEGAQLWFRPFRGP